MTAEGYGLPRRMWHQLEPVHAVFWYAPQVFTEAAALGYDVQTRWPSYFAWRLAPLGAAGPRLAASACYSFSPEMVAVHVPAAWAVAAPSMAGTAGMRSNGAPTGWPTPPGRRWAQPAPSGSPT
jgi:hypothetical protein